MTAKEILFQRVICSAYLAKVNDGAYIHHISSKDAEDRQDHFILCRGIFDPEKGGENEESECDGAYDLTKTYYERREKSFFGVCVGIKSIKTEGYLGVDYYDYGTPQYKVFKAPKTLVDCAIVYFANNQKRFVPMDAIRLQGG